MNNIFDNAKFSDKFLTRNHAIAIYLGKDKDNFHILTYMEDGQRYEELYTDEGQLKYANGENSSSDIVSKYTDNDEIDELKNELDTLQMQYLSQVSLLKCQYKKLKDLTDGKIDTEFLGTPIDNRKFKEILLKYPDDAKVTIEYCNPMQLQYNKESNLIVIN